QIGHFRQGTALSQWALARYLVGRTIGTSVSRTLLVVAIGLLVVAGLLQWSAHATFWTVLLVVVGLVVLAFRGAVRWVLARRPAVRVADPTDPTDPAACAVVAGALGPASRATGRRPTARHRPRPAGVSAARGRADGARCAAGAGLGLVVTGRWHRVRPQ